MGHTTAKRWLGVVGTGVVLGLLLVAYLDFVGGQQPRVIVCLSNVNIAGRGLLLYAMDHDGLLPPGESWMDVIPSAETYAPICPWARKEHPGAYGVALNYKLVEKRLADVANLEQVPMVFECPNTEKNAVSSFHRFRLPWHPDRMAMAYADGHAEHLRISGGR